MWPGRSALSTASGPIGDSKAGRTMRGMANITTVCGLASYEDVKPEMECAAVRSTLGPLPLPTPPPPPSLPEELATGCSCS